ncbi:hypothetical protein [Parasediminibacterium sp. JCM 36343]|uniref:hypothetical protein n=1 Tax=Parasediminibacterium sp. JCM 36343 TaxID=3374279 RepID=UPI00397E229D
MRIGNMLVLLVVSLMAGMGQLFGQDSTAVARQFMEICNQFQHSPLQATVGITSSTNYFTGPSDTAHATMEMAIDGNRAYLRMGPIEQLSDDSVLLLVNHASRQMTLYPNKGATKQQVYMKGITWQDSSVQKFMATYTAEQSGQGSIVVGSRNLVKGTAYPTESMAVRFDQKKREPQELVQVKRKWVAVDSATYGKLSGIQEWEGKLKAVPPAIFYALKEQKVVYAYKVGHKTGVVTAAIGQRVQKDATGNFTPCKGYEGFRVVSKL